MNLFNTVKHFLLPTAKICIPLLLSINHTSFLIHNSPPINHFGPKHTILEFKNYKQECLHSSESLYKFLNSELLLETSPYTSHPKQQTVKKIESMKFVEIEIFEQN